MTTIVWVEGVIDAGGVEEAAKEVGVATGSVDTGSAADVRPAEV